MYRSSIVSSTRCQDRRAIKPLSPASSVLTSCLRCLCTPSPSPFFNLPHISVTNVCTTPPFNIFCRVSGSSQGTFDITGIRFLNDRSETILAFPNSAAFPVVCNVPAESIAIICRLLIHTPLYDPGYQRIRVLWYHNYEFDDDASRLEMLRQQHLVDEVNSPSHCVVRIGFFPRFTAIFQWEITSKG
jgi:hypothetical protein